METHRGHGEDAGRKQVGHGEETGRTQWRHIDDTGRTQVVHGEYTGRTQLGHKEDTVENTGRTQCSKASQCTGLLKLSVVVSVINGGSAGRHVTWGLSHWESSLGGPSPALAAATGG